MIDGFEGYRSFAPADWEPPDLEFELERQRELLVNDRARCRISEGEGELLGHVTFLPAAEAIHAIDDPRLAHLRGLFVRPDRWGTGLATDLHRAGLEAAVEQGYKEMRLFTPVAQARARGFYEREGWRQRGGEFHHPGPDLALVEYRRDLRGVVPGPAA